jgi:anti-sigma regulatory factor (Ser/Thr protein kinase)
VGAAERFESREHALTADLSRLGEVRAFADEVAAEFGLDDKQRHHVRLAISEAVTNAIQHGSSSPEDPINISAVVEADALVFSVQDTGRFVPRVSRRGDFPEGGRGLDFMRRLMDEVDVRPGASGTELRLVKRL